MNSLSKGSLILNGVLILVIIFLRSCGGNHTSTPKQAKTDSSTHTIIQKVTELQTKIQKVYVPQYIRGKDNFIEVHDTTYVYSKPLTNQDSLEALKNYFVSTIYLDSITGNQVKGFIRDSIGRNKLLGRTYGLQNSRKTVINDLNSPKNKVFVGGQVGLSLGLKSLILAPSIMIETKKEAIYSLSYDFISQSPMFSTYFKIHIGK